MPLILKRFEKLYLNFDEIATGNFEEMKITEINLTQRSGCLSNFHVK